MLGELSTILFQLEIAPTYSTLPVYPLSLTNFILNIRSLLLLTSSLT